MHRIRVDFVAAGLLAGVIFATRATAAEDHRRGAPQRQDSGHLPPRPARTEPQAQEEATAPAPANDPGSVVLAPMGAERRIIGEQVRTHLDDITRCYDDRLARHPTLSGRIMARFDIGPDGRVVSATATGIDDQVLVRCVTDAISRWKFEKPVSGGRLGVAYPFVLRPTPES